MRKNPYLYSHCLIHGSTSYCYECEFDNSKIVLRTDNNYIISKLICILIAEDFHSPFLYAFFFDKNTSFTYFLLDKLNLVKEKNQISIGDYPLFYKKYEDLLFEKINKLGLIVKEGKSHHLKPELQYYNTAYNRKNEIFSFDSFQSDNKIFKYMRKDYLLKGFAKLFNREIPHNL